MPEGDFTSENEALPLIGEWVEVQGRYTEPDRDPPLARRMAGHRGTSHWECLNDWRGQVGVSHWRRPPAIQQLYAGQELSEDGQMDWPENDPPPPEVLECKSAGRGYAAESTEENTNDQEHTDPSRD